MRLNTFRVSVSETWPGFSTVSLFLAMLFPFLCTGGVSCAHFTCGCWFQKFSVHRAQSKFTSYRWGSGVCGSRYTVNLLWTAGGEGGGLVHSHVHKTHNIQNRIQNTEYEPGTCTKNYQCTCFFIWCMDFDFDLTKWYWLHSLSFQGPKSWDFQDPPHRMALEMDLPNSKLLHPASYK